MAFGSKKKIEKVREFTPYPRPEVVKKEEVQVTAAATASYIGKTMKIEGELVSEEDLTIEGEVSGTIEVSKTLTIGAHGSVSADINANVVQIIGRAKGNIVASDKVSILSRGRYTGNIHSKKLVVSEGAILIGDINKESEEDKKPEIVETPSEPVEITETRETAEAVETEETAESTEVQETADGEAVESEETGETIETVEIEEDEEEKEEEEKEEGKNEKGKRRRRR